MKTNHPIFQAVLLVLLTAAFQQPTQHLTDVPDHPWDLILARPTNNAVTASLLAYKDSEAYLEYGTSSGTYTAQTAVSSFPKGQPANIALSGLPANTRHYYRLRIRDVGSTEFTASQEFNFITKRPPGSTFTFTMQADSHLDENTDPLIYAQALANMRADNPDFLIDLGDTFMTDKYGTTYKDAAKQYLAQRYYFGLLCTNAPLLMALGNHDGEQGRYLNGTSDNMTIWSNTMRKSHFP
ncbi:MAG: metallophosphoesterase, partial [Blastocatellia bacterium]